MINKKALIEEIETNEITIVSEAVLAKDWLLPEEEAAWADL